jgi:hypothetical protein
LSEWDEEALKRLGDFGKLPDNAIKQACEMFGIKWLANIERYGNKIEARVFATVRSFIIPR